MYEIAFLIAVSTVLILGIRAVIDLRVDISDQLDNFHMCVEKMILSEHKKTRKETQEIKTRLTQVRKDLNNMSKDKTITSYTTYT